VELSHMNKLEHYLTNHLSGQAESFQELEHFAKEHRVPIMEPVSMNFLTQLVRMNQPNTILEIGTAIGYSALRMLDVHETATITTIEKDKDMYDLATKNVQQFDQSAHVSIKHGDALEVIEQLVKEEMSYDFIFIDAAKAHYQQYFEAVQSLTKARTWIVCDNILFKGYVSGESQADHKRLQQLTKKIQAFNAWLIEQPDYHTSIIPIGDGVSISVKIK